MIQVVVSYDFFSVKIFGIVSDAGGGILKNLNYCEGTMQSKDLGLILNVFHLSILSIMLVVYAYGHVTHIVLKLRGTVSTVLN